MHLTTSVNRIIRWLSFIDASVSVPVQRVCQSNSIFSFFVGKVNFIHLTEDKRFKYQGMVG